MIILNDFNTSVERALTEIEPKWRILPGLIVCGTHTPHDTEKMIREIEHARCIGLPFLGICFGHQLAAIEYARNHLGIKDATSQEFAEGPDSTLVVKKLDKIKIGLHDGESWWNNYHVDPFFEKLWKKPKNFITVQYHPEYQSSRDNPHPVLVDFIHMCRAYSDADTH